jgi:hypothetical protein
MNGAAGRHESPFDIPSRAASGHGRLAGADGPACAAPQGTRRPSGAHAGAAAFRAAHARGRAVSGRPAIPDGFAPRFETTRNWARQLAPFSPGPDDLSFDPARDLPLAQNLLERAGLGAQRDVLAGALVESATQLAALAAAHAPDERLAWAAAMTPVVAGAETGPLAFEAAVARLALVWAATSAQATDVLYGPLALDAVDAVFVLEGFQPDPLTSALAARWGERAETLALPHARAPRRRATVPCRRCRGRSRTRRRQGAGPHRGRPRARGPGRHRPRAHPARACAAGCAGRGHPR